MSSYEHVDVMVGDERWGFTIRQNDTRSPFTTDIWDEDGDTFIVIQRRMSQVEVVEIVRAYRLGLEIGKDIGAALKMCEIRRAIGAGREQGGR